MTYTSFDSAWWPFVFILLSASLPTMVWRWAAVLISLEIRDDSEVIVLVRYISTALVAAVVGQFIVYPAGAMVELPLFARLIAVGLGFGAAIATGRLFIGIVIGELALISLWAALVGF